MREHRFRSLGSTTAENLTVAANAAVPEQFGVLRAPRNSSRSGYVKRSGALMSPVPGVPSASA